MGEKLDGAGGAAGRGRAGPGWRAAGLALLAAIPRPAPAEVPAFRAGDPAEMCRRAGEEAERGHGLPAGLLLAIGRVESGRRDPATGRVSAWPWAVNAAGDGRLFETAAEALTAARAARARGVASIDAGCFQVNLLHHPAAFASLEEAFDPGANARYAARFLASLRLRTGSWEGAVAAYHSAAPERGGPYRDRVLADWGGMSGPAARAEPAVWTPAPGAWGMRIWTPSPPGSAPAVVSLRGPPVRAQAAAHAIVMPRG